MSESFHIISDGSCDLSRELAEAKNITVIPFYVSFDDDEYLKEGVDIGVRDFYRQMVERKGVYPKSSMPSTQDYVEAFQPFASQGMPVVCICITTKFSGSMQSAVNAREIVLEEHPDAQITVIDSTINTGWRRSRAPAGFSLRWETWSTSSTVGASARWRPWPEVCWGSGPSSP